MDLKDIISVSGKSGLFSTVGKSKNNVIVESIIDKKRFPIFNTNRISALSDISIYTYEEEMLLVLSDITGREFYSKVIAKIGDGKLITIPVDSSLPSGVYLITATSKSQIYSQKLIVQ